MPEVAEVAIVRPLGDTIVLMPPLTISKAELRRLVAIVAESVRAACADAYRDLKPTELPAPVAEPAEVRRAA
jgi:hypothetical protein